LCVAGREGRRTVHEPSEVEIDRVDNIPIDGDRPV
jgi:hypothetical protein